MWRGKIFKYNVDILRAALKKREGKSKHAKEQTHQSCARSRPFSLYFSVFPSGVPASSRLEAACARPGRGHGRWGSTSGSKGVGHVGRGEARSEAGVGQGSREGPGCRTSRRLRQGCADLRARVSATRRAGSCLAVVPGRRARGAGVCGAAVCARPELELGRLGVSRLGTGEAWR